MAETKGTIATAARKRAASQPAAQAAEPVLGAADRAEIAQPGEKARAQRAARRRESVTSPCAFDDASLLAAAAQARRIGNNLLRMAEMIENPETTARLRQAMAEWAFGYARLIPADEWERTSTEKIPKLRFLLHLMHGEAAGVKRWRRPEDVGVREQSAAVLERDASVGASVGASADGALARVLAQFYGLYPCDRGALDPRELRTALLLWLDDDGGRRSNADPRAKRGFGGGDKYAHLAIAIASTSFATTKATIKKNAMALRKLVPR